MHPGGDPVARSTNMDCGHLLCYVRSASFGVLLNLWAVVAGSSPAFLLVPVAIILAAVVLTAEKMKGDIMETENESICAKSQRGFKSVATKWWNVIRKLFGQSLIVLTAMVASMTAREAGQQS